GPDGRIQLATSDTPKRQKTNRRVKSTCSKAKQRILAFGSVTTGVAAIGRGIHSLCYRHKQKMSNRRHPKYAVIDHCGLQVFHFLCLSAAEIQSVRIPGGRLSAV